MSLFKEMLETGVNHVEAGAINFDAWSALMIDDLGPKVRPYLRDIMEWSVVLAHKGRDTSPLKLNCWDFFHCDKQAAGIDEKHAHVCPACLEAKLNGIHGGKNGGRACWVVKGTKCGGRITRTFIPKFIICRLCEFRRIVINEESSDFIVSDDFMKMLIH